MKYLIGAISAIVISLAFTGRKCEHVFTEVEQANIKIEQPGLTLNGQFYQPYSWPCGLQEGKELICVKCFHIQKQVLDYGKPANDPYIGPPLFGTNCCDSIKAFNSGSGAIFLKGGVLQVDTTGVIRLSTVIRKGDTLYGK